MALLDLHPGRRLSAALLSLLECHPAALLGGARERRARREVEERLAALPEHLRDDIGLPRIVRRAAAAGPDDATSMTAAMRS